MKNRLLTNWTFTRGLYLAMGIVIIIQSVIAKQWMGLALGGYFAAMGLFAIGCASGNCFAGNNTTVPKTTASIEEIEFEEVISK